MRTPATPDIIDQFKSGITEDESCPYLPKQRWRSLILCTGPLLSMPDHEDLLNQSFRRMGRMLYRPVCDDCRECRPLRIDVERFAPSKSQRRAWNKNRDVEIQIAPAAYTDEKRDLLRRYLEARHSGPMIADETSMRASMYDSPGSTYCVDYRVHGRLIGSGIIDLLPRVVSSIYFFFDPSEARRSLGVFSMMAEIYFARSHGRPWFHPGFYVRGCDAMAYKSTFKPCEYLDVHGEWRPFGVTALAAAPAPQAMRS
jgi:leucyl-tRNA---protein transferase